MLELLTYCLLMITFVVYGSARADAPSAQYLPSNGGSGGGNGGNGGNGYGGNGGGDAGGPGEEGGKPEPFNFFYEVKDAESGNDYSHKADSDGTVVKGEYQVLLPDGRRQTVTYTADSQGYNADVQYEGEAITDAGTGAGGSGFGATGGASGNGFNSSGGGAAGYPSGGPGGKSGEKGRNGRPNSSYLPPRQ